MSLKYICPKYIKAITSAAKSWLGLDLKILKECQTLQVAIEQNRAQNQIVG
jgi:hypothetical protein